MNVTPRLVKDAALFLDPVTGEYRATPPERYSDALGGPVVRGGDVAEWPTALTRFREKWEGLTADQQAEALRAVPDARSQLRHQGWNLDEHQGGDEQHD